MPAKIIDTGDVVPVAAVETDNETAHASLIDQTRDALKKQPKVQVKIRAEADVPVQINGYTYLIQPNVKVSVPESVAALLEEAGYI